jgi:hypothetical protein
MDLLQHMDQVDLRARQALKVLRATMVHRVPLGQPDQLVLRVPGVITGILAQQDHKVLKVSQGPLVFLVCLDPKGTQGLKEEMVILVKQDLSVPKVRKVAQDSLAPLEKQVQPAKMEPLEVMETLVLLVPPELLVLQAKRELGVPMEPQVKLGLWVAKDQTE